MYFIEIFQAFTGRLPEVDDLIANIAGFLVGYLTAQGFLELFDKKAYKYGIIRILSTVILFCISIFALSFWANGDALQAEEEAYVNVIDEKIRQFQYPCWNRYGSFLLCHRLGKQKQLLA